MKSLISLLLFISCAHLSVAREILVKNGSNWFYSNGERMTDPKWNTPDFDETQWENGAAPFVYGHYQGNTIIDSTVRPRPITTYYRTSFNLDDPEDWEFFEFMISSDDGCLIYLNGTLAVHMSMPMDGEVNSTTLAKYTWENPYCPPSRFRINRSRGINRMLRKGKNSISVEVHQSSAASKDLKFELEVSAARLGTVQEMVFKEKTEWAYYDQRRLPAEDWASPDYDDSSWKRGEAAFGYGNNKLSTTTNSGDDEKNKPITTWFRKEFTVDEKMNPDAIFFRFRLDDGAVFYLNGEEIFRENMPSGIIDQFTLSSKTVSHGIETFRFHRHVPAHLLKPGKNLIAVSVHQRSADSSDLTFTTSLRIEHQPDKPRTLPPVVVATKKPVDITNKEALKSSEAGDWLASSLELKTKALASYKAKKLSPAIQSYYASLWAHAFAHEGRIMAAPLKEYLLDPKQVAVSQEFFDLYSARDSHSQVYQIIQDIYNEQTESFQAFPKLALAIALVYDQAPPTDWPHHQVSSHVLPRKLPTPSEAMTFWVETERSSKSLHPLAELSIEELKYVVDTPASLTELKEAQEIRLRLGSMNSQYSGINYVYERLETNTYNWPHRSYDLTKIKEEGGICVDQAYYTVQLAKAHGVPAMMISGAGNNGNHAWVGFLDKQGRWDFTVGRYEESKFVTGITFDPQTWEQPTDHQIAMLSERFRNQSDFRLSRLHTVFAEEYLRQKEWASAISAAEEAIKSEDRNFSAWEALITARKKDNASQKEMDELYENGAKAFSKYADLEAHFLRRLSNSYEEQDRASEAEKLRTKIISRNRRERPDLALEEAKALLEESMSEVTPEEQLALYRQQISRLREAGLIAYYALTDPFLRHLVSEERQDLAADALKYTSRRMKVKEASQLESALFVWSRKLGLE